MVLDYSGRKTLKHTSNDPLPDAQKREMKVWSRKNISVNSNLENMFLFGTSRPDAFSACRLLSPSPGLVDRGMCLSVSSWIHSTPTSQSLSVRSPWGFSYTYTTRIAHPVISVPRTSTSAARGPNRQMSRHHVGREGV